ncbi:substrate-binding periplasmic protein [Pelosinus sp. sgz500959]|uniref:substrate-binding periplasmic protein n=1 Tax=Pelosinus sp. sgz500959 TaxID=3242472 RepID=UPI003671F4AF
MKKILLLTTIMIIMVAMSGCGSSVDQRQTKNNSSVVTDANSNNNVNSNQSNMVIFYLEEQKRDGYLYAISQEAFKRVGYETRAEYLPWARTIKVTMEGESDVTIGYYSKERLEKMSYSDPIGKAELVLFQKKDKKISYSNLEDLKPYRIGTQRGAVISDEFDAATYLTKEPADSPHVNLNKLVAGRIDLLLEQRDVIQQYLVKEFPNEMNNIVAIEPPVIIKGFYCIFSKKRPNYEQKIKDFNIGLKMITEDGTLKKIMTQYDHP